MATPFLISALDADEWSATRPGRFTPNNENVASAPKPISTLWKGKKLVPDEK
jgi:hypothetical protein